MDSPPLSRGARRSHAASSARLVTHPRSRGEHDAAQVGGECAQDSPPLSRGARSRRKRQCRTGGLTPALAGSTERHRPGHGPGETHPRSRGEHPGAVGVRIKTEDSPPLSRGAQGGRIIHVPLFGLTPALAGSTRDRDHGRPARRTHPRSRGEHGRPRRTGRRRTDSPPLSRGAQAGELAGQAGQGLTPALAGSTARSVVAA